MTQPVTPDRSDLIVGTMRPPAWLGAVPRLVWLFLALAAVDVVVRLTFFGSFGPLTPQTVASVAIGLAQPTLMVAMPAAVLLGRHDGPAGRALFLGALSLMLAEGIFLGAQALDRALGVGAATSDIDRFAVVRFVGALLALAGAVFLAIGIRSSASSVGTRGAARGGVVLIAIAVAGAIVDLVVLAGYVSRSPADLAGLVTPLALVGNGIGIATGVVWGLLAAVALRGWSGSRGRGRGLVAAGTATVVVSGAISTILTFTVFSSAAVLAAIGDAAYLAIFEVSVALRALGLSLVLGGLAVAFGAAEADAVEQAETIEAASQPA